VFAFVSVWISILVGLIYSYLKEEYMVRVSGIKMFAKVFGPFTLSNE
jgi:hypothetical protein